MEYDRNTVNALLGSEVVKEGEKIIYFESCMWCKRIMPVVVRKIGHDTAVCAGCNASAEGDRGH